MVPWPLLDNADKEQKKGVVMYVSILEYRIHDIDEATWLHTCEDLAHRIAEVPGLMAKLWLHGAGGVRGGVHVWADKASCDRFLASDLAAMLAGHPNVADLSIKEYGIDEAPTGTTRGMAFGAAWAAQFTR